MSKVWLVTGSASGLGRNIAEAVLASGDQLVATARDPRRLEDLVKKYGDQIRTAPLDVTDERQAAAAARVAVDAFGRLDVVVNNAGYGDIAPFEQLSAERFKAVVDTNFYGVVNVCRAAVPIMRKQKSGCILQISSVGGRLARPGNSPYHAAKWAVGGFTESLAQEVAPFGVKVCALEPGGMRTNWGVRANQDTSDLLPDYEPSVGSVVKALASYWGHETSDPVKVAQVILRLAGADRLPAHLLLGSDAAKHAADAEATRAADAARWRDISVSTDFDAHGALPDVEFARPKEELGRIAAEADPEIILQRVREPERENIYNEYIDRIGEVLNGIVKRFERGDIIVDLGRIEAVVPRNEQMRNERYSQGERIRAVIIDVHKQPKGPQIVLSRTSPELLKRLFETEVNEIYDGTVVIKAVVREAGDQAKIAVASTKRDVDPVDACVGLKGSRVQSVSRELRSEKIDIVQWSEDPAVFAANALLPAKVLKVEVSDSERKRLTVIVPEDQLSFALGRKGVNQRLAIELVGWHIDIPSGEGEKAAGQEN